MKQPKKPKKIYTLTINGIVMPNAFTTISALCEHYPISKVTPARAALASSDHYIFNTTEQDAVKSCIVSRLTIIKMLKGDIHRMIKKSL